jgi:hypothetical protein
MTKLMISTMKYEMVATSETLRGRNEIQNPRTFKTAQGRITEFIISSMFVARKTRRRASIQYYIKTYITFCFILMLEHEKFTLRPTISQMKFSM